MLITISGVDSVQEAIEALEGAIEDGILNEINNSEAGDTIYSQDDNICIEI